MITPSFGLTATERVLPRMALDFTTASLDSRVTFTRAGNTATCVNSSGNVALVNANLPRFDFNPTTLTCNGLLIEESRTNLIFYSEDLTNLLWAKSGSSISANAILAPSGSVTADKIVEDTSTSSHGVNQFTPIATTAYSISFFAKAAERSKIAFTGGGFNGQGFTAIFNLSNGTMFANAGNKATISPYPNGWYRCVIAFTASAATGLGFSMLDASNNSTYTGNGTSGLYFWGAQIEVGAFATSYIPTVASTVTRTADVAVMTGTNFSSWYNSTQGSVMFEGICNASTAATGYLTINDGSAGDFLRLTRNFGLANYLVSIAAGTQANLFSVGSMALGVNTKTCIGYKLDNIKLSLNAETVVVDTSATLPAPANQMLIGFGIYTGYLNGIIKKINYYPQLLISPELQAFSK